MKECDRFEKELYSTLKVNKKKSIAYLGYTWMNEITDNIMLVGILFYGGHLVLTKKMAVDGLFSFLLYQLQLGENLYVSKHFFKLNLFTFYILESWLGFYSTHGKCRSIKKSI